MGIQTARIGFSEHNIRIYAPDKSGVYCLYDQYGRIIYYGKADQLTIKERLLAHFKGAVTACTKSAITFNFEVTDKPSEREIQLLKEFQGAYRSLPRCNERIG